MIIDAVNFSIIRIATMSRVSRDNGFIPYPYPLTIAKPNELFLGHCPGFEILFCITNFTIIAYQEKHACSRTAYSIPIGPLWNELCDPPPKKKSPHWFSFVSYNVESIIKWQYYKIIWKKWKIAWKLLPDNSVPRFSYQNKKKTFFHMFHKSFRDGGYLLIWTDGNWKQKYLLLVLSAERRHFCMIQFFLLASLTTKCARYYFIG